MCYPLHMSEEMQKQTKSDFSRAFSEDGALKTHVGGQALLEGIMMRGKVNWAVAVREPDGGIYVEQHDLAAASGRGTWTTVPFVRGVKALVDSLVLGYKALDIAARHAFADEEAEPPAQSAPAASPIAAESVAETAKAPAKESAKDDGFGAKEMAISGVLGIVLAVVLFIVAPAFVTNLIVGEYDQHTLLWNIVDGVLRVAVFIFYVWLIGRMSDIKRMFAYHGAEHKTIHCFEHGLPLTPQNAQRFPRLHIRCGTAFLINVMIIAILVYSIIPVGALINLWGVTAGPLKLLLVIVVRIIFLPVIAGIAYEINVKWAGTHPDNPAVKVVLWPGLQMQYLTTNEPDEGMLECAIAAMQCVLKREQELAEGHAPTCQPVCEQEPA